MNIAHTLARTVAYHVTALCLLVVVALALVSFTSACSDSPSPVEVTSAESIRVQPTSVPHTQAVRYELEAAATPVSGKGDSADIPASSEANAVRYEPEATATPVSSKEESAGIPAPLATTIAGITWGSARVDTSTGHIVVPRESVDPSQMKTTVDRMPEKGPLDLEERILRADIIARATLSSVSTSTPFLSDTDLSTTTPQYVSTIELRFDAHEYLKGSGGPTLTVALPVSFREYYPSELEAVAAAYAWLTERDTRWDDREAIIFLQEPIGSLAESHTGVHVFSIYDLAYGEAHDDGTAYAVDEYYIDTYSIRSEKNKTWLPATAAPTSGASGQVEASYYLEEPPSAGTGASGASGQSAGVSSITLSDLKTRIQGMNTLIEQGEGVDGYKRCLEEKYESLRYERYLESQPTRKSLPVNKSLVSGLPAGSIVDQGALFGGSPGGQYNRPFFVGPDTHLFEIAAEDNDTNTSAYSIVTRTKRPVPQGMYEVHYKMQSWLYLPCNYVPDNYSRWIITVNAPARTIHEAFFDPVLDTSTSAVGADAANGVLKPSAFSGSGGATTTISRLEWKSGAVKMNVSPHTALDGQVLDFIELDGTVSLSLYAADATADAANNALSWTVASQPWEDGDKLMLRIRKGPNRPPVFSTSTYAFAVREDASKWHIMGSVSASDPDPGDSVWYYITDGNGAGRFNLGANKGEFLVWAPLDYETASSYTLSIEARDGNENGTATATVQISVTDVAE